MNIVDLFGRSNTLAPCALTYPIGVNADALRMFAMLWVSSVNVRLRRARKARAQSARRVVAARVSQRERAETEQLDRDAREARELDLACTVTAQLACPNSTSAFPEARFWFSSRFQTHAFLRGYSAA